MRDVPPNADAPPGLATNVDPINHYPRLWGWLCRGIFGIIQWCEEYTKSHMWGCPTEQFRHAADRINKFCDLCDQEKLTGGYHIDYSKNRRKLLKDQRAPEDPGQPGED